MSASRQVTIWCDACANRERESEVNYDAPRLYHVEFDVEQVSHARHLASGEGWTRRGRHGDLCPFHSTPAPLSTERTDQ